MSFTRTKDSNNDNSGLITTGLYNYTRNPMYLMHVVGTIGTFLLVSNLLTLTIFIVTIIASYELSLEEEKGLLKKFGEDYEHYRKKVGLLFPKLKRRRKSLIIYGKKVKK